MSSWRREDLLDVITNYSPGGSASIHQPAINFSRCPTCNTYVSAEQFKQTTLAQRQIELQQRQQYALRLQEQSEYLSRHYREAMDDYKNELHTLKEKNEKLERKIRRMKKKDTNNLLPALIVESSQQTRQNKEEMKQSFLDQTEFVKVGLGLDEEAVDKIKMKDLPQKVVEAQQEITVGSMKKLIDIRIKPLGVVESIVSFLTKKR